MNLEKRNNKQRQLIETIGLAFERDGMQPVMGRIMGLLMVMDKEQFTFDEIVEELKISKSSASVGLRLLQLNNMVEYTTLPGDRKRYFRMKCYEPGGVFNDIRQRLVDKRNLMTEIMELKSDNNSKNSQFFEKLIEITDHFISVYDEYKSSYDELEKDKN